MDRVESGTECAGDRSARMAKLLYFLAIMLTAIALGAGLAHLFELPNKIGLGAEDYLTVQRNYDNWWIVGLIVPLAFLAVLALTIALQALARPSCPRSSHLFCSLANLPRSGASPRRSIAPPRTGPRCRRIGRNCAHSGSIPTPCVPSSTSSRWAPSSCPCSTGARKRNDVITISRAAL